MKKMVIAGCVMALTGCANVGEHLIVAARDCRAQDILHESPNFYRLQKIEDIDEKYSCLKQKMGNDPVISGSSRYSSAIQNLNIQHALLRSVATGEMSPQAATLEFENFSSMQQAQYAQQQQIEMQRAQAISNALQNAADYYQRQQAIQMQQQQMYRPTMTTCSQTGYTLNCIQY